LFAALGGAFGWGLKRNVLDLYRYACRNYRDGDQIYGFGFSRGAFTMRVVIALIASEGLVRSTDESELNRRSLQAYRAFRSTFQPRKFRGFTTFGRWLRDSWVARRDRRRNIAPYSRTDNREARIRFVGVWDTVAAYGGPISEITRAIDNWLYPLSMPDYQLNASVECARHALAIDDERDAFQPLLWDEVHEDALINQGKVKPDRLQQVWFTGMHSDVGGGYPDESLSYVSLLWMMEEAEKVGLRTLPAIKERFFALANSYGPMHDSRSGFASYYRYQPRKIAAWVDSPGNGDASRYLMLRDPDIKNSKGDARGMLRCVCVHESVIARINSGTVRYAPIALPEHFSVIPPQREGETVEQTGDSETACKHPTPPSEPLISPETRALVEGEAQGRFACQENLWDLVWWRRVAYFSTVTVTLLLVALPFVNLMPSAVDATCSDSRCVLPSLIRPLKALVPGFAEPWIAAIARYPVTAIIFIIGIYLLWRRSGSIEARLRDSSHRLWQRLLGGEAISADECRETRLRKFREGATYQKLVGGLKWYAMPGLFAVIMFLTIFYLPSVAVAQLVIQANEATHHFCPPDDPSKLRKFDRATFMFTTRSRCVRPHLIIEKGQVYEIVFQLPVTDLGEPVGWWDKGVAAKDGSLVRVPASSFFQVIGVPMRRVIEASYLQPLVQTSKLRTQSKSSRWMPQWLHRWRSQIERVRISEIDLQQDEEWPELYRARFRARDDTSLHLFANEAHLPFAGTWFYNNNCGIAKVVITKVVPRGRGFPLMEKPSGSVRPPDCAKPLLKKDDETPGGASAA
jgi:uncharacterized protein (DUF2235 family)